MLRARLTRSLPPRQSQRPIWSRASDFVSRLCEGFKPGCNFEKTPIAEQKQPQPPTIKDTPISPPTRSAHKHNFRPTLPVDVALPTFHHLVNAAKQKSDAYAFDHFALKSKVTPTQLLEAWQVVSQCRPFVVRRNAPLRVRLATANDVVESRSWLLQIVPANIFAQLSTNHPEPPMFVGVSSALTELGTKVIVINETVVVGTLIKAFDQKSEHTLAVAFFGAYDRDRSLWLQEHYRCSDSSSGDEVKDGADLKPKDKPESIEMASRLPPTVYMSYIRSLAALKHSKKIVQLFESDKLQLEKVFRSVSELNVLLQACYTEKNGTLARKAIDAMMNGSPAAVIPLKCYELAIQTCLRSRNGEERTLLTAIDLANVLSSDGGYTLKPHIWSTLISVSLDLNRSDLALEVFKSYPRHRISDSQIHFRRALRAACRKTDTTALEMMRFRWATYNTGYSNAQTLLQERNAYKKAIHLSDVDAIKNLLGDSTRLLNVSASNKTAEADLLNFIMRRMLKHRHAVSSLVQVLDLMEATRTKGSSMVLRQSVVILLEHDIKEKKMSSRAAIEHSLHFWEKHPSVLRGLGFLVLLLLDECLEHQWDDDCEFLVDFMLDRRVTRVPSITIVKVMESNEVRGRFEANVRIGEKLLEKLSQKNRQRLRDDFYERLLMSYLRLEQFDQVSDLHAKWNLEKRYPHNEAIRTIVHDANARTRNNC